MPPRDHSPGYAYQKAIDDREGGVVMLSLGGGLGRVKKSWEAFFSEKIMVVVGTMVRTFRA